MLMHEFTLLALKQSDFLSVLAFAGVNVNLKINVLYLYSAFRPFMKGLTVPWLWVFVELLVLFSPMLSVSTFSVFGF